MKVSLIVALTFLFATVASQMIVVVNFGCKKFNKDGTICLQCSNRFYNDTEGICQPVSPSCKGYN
jgi:hypothetical protein